MTGIPHIPESAPFTAEQRAWLNGFLAGLFSQTDAGQALPQTSPATPVVPAEPLLVLYGSQTGTAERLARKISDEARQHGFAPQVAELNAHASVNFAAAGKAVIVSSTWGDGEPPDNAANFWSWLNAANAPRLEKMRFAVLGLGDRNYGDFCGASKKFDARLEALGATRIVPRGECDTDYETAATAWIKELWSKIGNGTTGIAAPAPTSTAGVKETPARESLSATPYGRNNPYAARLLNNVLLNKPGSAKEVRHYELSLADSGLQYEVGDALGVVPMNCPELVEDMLAVMHRPGEGLIKYGNAILTLREAFTRQFELRKPTLELLRAVAPRATDPLLASLLAPERAEELKKWLWGREVVDILGLLKEPFTPDELLPLLRKLEPRLYSISSSPRAHPGEAHLTVSAVRYESHGKGRKGVASTFLADRVGNADFIRVFVQSSKSFKPPQNPSAPMIMVGPGTGIAPFRAFLEERQATGATGKNWLIFGDQKRDSDFLYEQELLAWQKSGFLTRLDLAFSRDQAEKIYVQDRMLENAQEFWSWLEQGAHFYVCGDASRMAKDVDAALHRIIETAGGKSSDEAKAWVEKMKSEKRYQRDVY